jgi:3'(2'), 5'-bisphosphate nucleotidase
MSLDYSALMPEVVRVAFAAGRAILQVYHHEVFDITTKVDSSPVTQADILAHDIIAAGLAQLMPEVPILSEEGLCPAFSERQQWSDYWLVDPLDGTKEFIARTDEFSVNIALIRNHEPVMGVIFAPALGTAYFASRGLGAFRQDTVDPLRPLLTRKWATGQPLAISVSRRQSAQGLAELMEKLGDYSVLSMGSSLKFCAIAEQRADLYPRLGPTSEWDTAAGQCILSEAGGAVVDLQGLALRYNTKEDIRNPGFMATGDLVSLLKYLQLIKGKL